MALTRNASQSRCWRSSLVVKTSRRAFGWSVNNRGLLQYDLGLKQVYMQSAERSLAVANRLYSASPTPCADDLRLKALYNLSPAHSELKDARADATLAK